MRDLLAHCSAFTLLVPLAATFVILCCKRSDEKNLARIASLSIASLLLGVGATLIAWVASGADPMEFSWGELYRHGNYRFPIALFFDLNTAVFLAVTTFLGAVIVKYCRYYLHRDPGYRRFFATIFLFLFGMNLLVLSGTLDLLFAGWEVLGISSFLLIGFYRERVTPQRNAFRAYTIYRLCDVGLLLSAWLGHRIWHETQHFVQLGQLDPQTLAGLGTGPLLGMCLLILLAACGKSAQFPFCFWLPRAMEGPTPSSAIYYGALSVHAGVFLLLRTYPLWHAMTLSRIAVAVIGVLTASVAAASGKVQSNIKAQIGYASIAQVGLMLVELSLGLPELVLIHFAGNAFWRCYQLLVSPSVVAHLLRMQSASHVQVKAPPHSLFRLLPQKLQRTLYVVALNEGYLESTVRGLCWDPIQRLGRLVNRWDSNSLRLLGVMVAALGVWQTNFGLLDGLPIEYVLIVWMVASSLSASAERRSPFRAWHAVGFSAALAAASVFAADPSAAADLNIYLSGILPSWAVGTAALLWIAPSVGTRLDRYLGQTQRHPKGSALFFFCALGLSGFPVTPAFLGEDLLLHHATAGHLWLAAAITLVFVLNGITLVRIYSRLCLGPMPVEAVPH